MTPRLLKTLSVATLLLLSACAGQTQSAGSSTSVRSGPPKVPFAELRNMTADTLAGALGKPEFTRRDAPAQLWRYRGQTCVLDLFLYADANGIYRVAHIESRDATAASMDAAICLAQLN